MSDIFNVEHVIVIRYGVVANIIASHAIARGSIPRVGIHRTILSFSVTYDGTTAHASATMAFR